MRRALIDTGWFLRRNWIIALFLAAGVTLRVLAIVAYRPALLYVDSVTIYLNHLPNSGLLYENAPSPDPLGYNMLWLQPLLWAGNLFTVVLLQHVLGIGMAVTMYTVLRRRNVWRWLAALAAAPILLDAYQVYIEHMIMSDTVFEALLVGAFAALLWYRRPGPVTIGIAGLCLGAATVVRLVGAPLIALFLIYLLIVMPKPSFKMLGAGLVALSFLVPVLGYSLYMVGRPAQFSADNTKASALYARAATFVDCSTLKMPDYERQLCPVEPLGARRSPDYYAHTDTSPAFHVRVPPGMTVQQLETDFAVRAMKQQPLRLSSAVLRDAVRLFTWNHDNLANPDAPAERWRFQVVYPTYPEAVYLSTVSQMGRKFGGGEPRTQPLVAAFMRVYQLEYGFTPGPFMALCLLVAAAGVLGVGRWRRAPNRLPAFLFLGGAILVLGAADFYEFTWRYQFPGLVLIPMAGALGLMTLLWKPAAATFPEPDDEIAIDSFGTEYDRPAMPPVTVVIAAYNEAKGIGAVLDGMPKKTEDDEGLEIATIVVVDGGTDDTAAIAREHGAYVCEMPRNRGQGAALRLGYHLARTGGARYIVTTDADGQYDIGQLSALLEPLRTDEADFVTGSRRLGNDHSRDWYRRLGVWVFATAVTILTRTRVTDTSFGFRAMRAEVTGTVTLNQPQYQSSELLIGVISRGYRVVERPMTMRVRNQGRSKKGNNLVYGFRYARVVLSTWSRERTARLESPNTNRSSSKNLATNVTAYDPK